MKEKGMSKGEFLSVAQVNGGMDQMINWEGKDKDTLALLKYIAPHERGRVEKGSVCRNRSAAFSSITSAG